MVDLRKREQPRHDPVAGGLLFSNLLDEVSELPTKSAIRRQAQHVVKNSLLQLHRDQHGWARKESGRIRGPMLSIRYRLLWRDGVIRS